MVTTKKATGMAMSMPVGLALGGTVSLIVTLIMSAIIAKLVDGEVIAENAIGYGALFTLLSAAMAGAFCSSRKIKRQRLLVCLLSGLIYYITLLSITAIFFGGQYKGMGVTALVIAGGCGAVILMGMRQGKVKGKAFRKKVHR